MLKILTYYAWYLIIITYLKGPKHVFCLFQLLQINEGKSLKFLGGKPLFIK